MFILRLKLCSKSFLNVIKSKKKLRPSSYPRISVNLKMFKRVNQNQSPFFGETVQQLTSKNGLLILHSYISCNYCIKSFLKGMEMLLSLFSRIDFFSWLNCWWQCRPVGWRCPYIIYLAPVVWWRGYANACSTAVMMQRFRVALKQCQRSRFEPQS